VIVVVGGGLIGTSVAWHLARRGREVTLLEQGEIGRGCSYGNAGIFAPAHAPLARPGVFLRGMRWMFDRTSPLYVTPARALRMAPWLNEFRRACGEDAYRAGRAVLADLGRRTVPLFDEMLAEGGAGAQCSLRRGFYDLYVTDAGLAGGRGEAEACRAAGFSCDVVDRAPLREREPALRDDVAGALWHPEGASCDPYAFVAGVARAAAARGVALRGGVRVTGLGREGDRVTGVVCADGTRVAADTVVVAAGAWTPVLLRACGVRVDLRVAPAKGYHVMLASPEPPLHHASVVAETFVACTPMGGALRLAGTLEFSGHSDVLRPERLGMLPRGAARAYAGVEGTAATAPWCGLRPCTPDSLPVIGAVPGVRGLYVNTGHGMMGLTLAPVSGALLAGMIAGEAGDGDGALAQALRCGRSGA
jgi:D-amino-acid dehydrogenase